jgi:hypothetical protein
VVLFGPSSFTLTSDGYDALLEGALRESLPETRPSDEIDELMKVLRRRKQIFHARKPNVVNIITTTEIERFLLDGLVGSRHVSDTVRRERETTYVLVSPFRLGARPNIAVGVAMITSSPEAIELHSRVVDELWLRAQKGADGARVIRGLLDRIPPTA